MILCEGKNDAWFFDEIMTEHLGDRVYTMADRGMSTLQRLLGGGCFDFIKNSIRPDNIW